MHATGAHEELWGAILAGGDGTRLRRLTLAVAGDARPKQFTPLLAEQTLLDRTRHRVALAVAPERTLLVLTESHRPYWPALEDEPDERDLLVQPHNRGTAPAILYAALRVAAVAPMGTVAVFPADHWVSDDELFMRHVRCAVAAVDEHPELVVLLGIAATEPETDYGWIEPGETIPGTDLLRIRRFWEKPGAALAQTLLVRQCLWNTFVIVARVAALLCLARVTMPALWDVFAPLRAAIGSGREGAGAQDVYRALDSRSFSSEVLNSCPRNLAVLPVTGVEWSDWGSPARVLRTLAQLGISPAWAASMLFTAR
jgi:mannose-1-phosphate guanylyltransferase